MPSIEACPWLCEEAELEELELAAELELACELLSVAAQPARAIAIANIAATITTAIVVFLSFPTIILPSFLIKLFT